MAERVALSIRLLCSSGFARAASAAQRLSHGLMFLAAGTRRIADYRSDAAATWADYNLTAGDMQTGLNALEERVYGRHVKAGARLCVIGCGNGRDLVPFAANGHEVVGIEPAARPLDALRSDLHARGLTATLIQGFVEDTPLPGAFDFIILSPHCYSYVAGSERRVAVLRRLADHLAPGGMIAINFLRRTGSWSRIGVRVASLAARASGSDCPWEPHDIVRVHDVQGRQAMTFEHYFLPSEIAAEAARAGLRVIDAEVDDFLGPLTIVGR